MGVVAEDLELDAMEDAAETQIVDVHNVIGRYAPLVAAFCRNTCVREPRAQNSTPFRA